MKIKGIPDVFVIIVESNFIPPEKTRSLEILADRLIQFFRALRSSLKIGSRSCPKCQ